MAEKKKTEAQLLKEKLCYNPKNAGERFSDNEWEKADLFCEGYKKFLDMAKTEVGFDPAGDKVLIQLYPLKSGGCELFVTKLGILSESSARLVSKSDRIAMLSKNRSLYAFDSLDNIVGAARAVKRIMGGLSPKSDVYIDGERYYLSIEEYGKGGEPVEFPCILEFGMGLTAELSSYIYEHADLLPDGDGIASFALL